jgi:hypothetical protein
MTALTLQRGTSTPPGPRAPTARDEWMIRAARERLSPLLARAAALELDDEPGWAHLRSTAHATTSLLCAAELLPPHLHVRHGDPPVVVARTIAAAWRRVSAAV